MHTLAEVGTWGMRFCSVVQKVTSRPKSLLKEFSSGLIIIPTLCKNHLIENTKIAFLLKKLKIEIKKVKITAVAHNTDPLQAVVSEGLV